MIRSRPPKKSETLEVRLPLETKAAFMARCRDAGLTASEVVRGLIEREPLAPPARLRGWQAGLLAAAGIAIGAVAAPSIAQALPGSRAAFDQMDSNRDGVVTFSEFRSR
jgi:anti-sigma factor RsiW